MADALARGLGLESRPQLLNKYRAGDVRHCFADPSRAREVLGFEAQYSLEDGLPALVEWCRGETASDDVERSLRELMDRRLVQ